MIATRFKHYIEQLQQYTSSLFVKKSVNKVVSTHRCCIMIHPHKLDFIHVNRKETGIEWLAADSLTYAEAKDLPLILSGIVKKYQLKGMPTDWLLAPHYYQLFLIESLPVAANEIKQALNWRIRGFIDYPVEEAVIDQFQLPGKKLTQDTPIIVAVVARKMMLADTIDQIKQSGLELTTIDIPELALHSLINFDEKDEKTIACIYFDYDSVILNISQQKILYFTRRINVTAISGTDDVYEQVCLEVLRFFDYYQSQWRLPSPTRIYVGAAEKNLEEIISKLSSHLLMPVERYEFKTIIVDPLLKEVNKQHFLLPVGSAISEDQD